MIDERGVISCDCCARQILQHRCDDEHTVGPRSEARGIEFHKHCCGKCWPDYKAWTEMEERRFQL